MRTQTIRFFVMCISLAMLTNLTGMADAEGLKLHGKTLLICPIILQEAGTPNTKGFEQWQAVSLAELLATRLERRGMTPSISPPYPKAILAEEDLSAIATQLHALRGTWKKKSVYILFARFEAKAEGERYVARARAILVDADGKIIWSQDPEKFSEAGNMWPIGLSMQIVETLAAKSDLTEEKNEPGPLEKQLRQKAREKK